MGITVVSLPSTLYRCGSLIVLCPLNPVSHPFGVISFRGLFAGLKGGTKASALAAHFIRHFVL